MLSGNKGSGISVIPRNNTLVITDIPEYVDKIVRMVGELDKESPQIAILAKIVVASYMFLWLTFDMTLRLTPKQHEAIRRQPGRLIEIEDVEIQRKYILMTQEQFEILTHDETSRGR